MHSDNVGIALPSHFGPELNYALCRKIDYPEIALGNIMLHILNECVSIINSVHFPSYLTMRIYA